MPCFVKKYASSKCGAEFALPTVPLRTGMRNKRAMLEIICASILLVAALFVTGCSSTKNIGNNDSLLVKNKVTLKSNNIIYNKGEMKDNLLRLVVQKTNSKEFGARRKLWYYNFRYDKFHSRPDSLLPKSAERPVLLDTSAIPRSIANMRAYLFNQGYFYAKIYDTIITKGKESTVSYTVNTGSNYLVNKVNYLVDDSAIALIVREAASGCILKKNKVYTYSMFDEERSRLGAVIRNKGYYRFSQENIRFEIDTMDKAFFRDVENPLENAINFIANSKSNKKPTNDINVFIRSVEDSSNVPFRMGYVRVYADYGGVGDLLYDSVTSLETRDSIQFRFHEHYVHPQVLADHLYFRPGKLYAQEDHDKTTVKLNELGIFQYIRIQLTERKKDSTLNCSIYLNRNKKYELTRNFEVSNGSTYALGSSATVGFRNKNFGKGANLLVIALNGGLELSYNEKKGQGFVDHFDLLTKYYGLNSSIDFPKFLAPVGTGLFDNSNLPRTIITAGANVVDRVQYFTLVNTSTYFKYNWHATRSQIWELSPLFVNVISLPRKTADFQARLDTNKFLSDSYKENFIEGESLTYLFNNIEKKMGRNYFRLKVTLEEAGGLLGGLNSVGYALNDLFRIHYAQYVKLDLDVQKFFTLPHSVFAFRFYTGIGSPYGASDALPYVKQYYVGGPYSLRGWRIRSLGPGSFVDPAAATSSNTLDRTGDIKIEMNGEYRFPILPLFAGTVKMNGALFSDVGNIWLAKASKSTPGGEFSFNKLGPDLAMDMGAGTRFEIASFLTLRLDVAIPVKDPAVTANGGWEFSKIDLGTPGWRAKNVIVNLSIGYPF